MKTGPWALLLIATAIAAWWTGRESGMRYHVVVHGPNEYYLMKLDRWTGKTWTHSRRDNTWTLSESTTREQIEAQQRVWEALEQEARKQGIDPTAQTAR
jgi:hypothetical protein